MDQWQVSQSGKEVKLITLMILPRPAARWETENNRKRGGEIGKQLQDPNNIQLFHPGKFFLMVIHLRTTTATISTSLPEPQRAALFIYRLFLQHVIKHVTNLEVAILKGLALKLVTVFSHTTMLFLHHLMVNYCHYFGCKSHSHQNKLLDQSAQSLLCYGHSFQVISEI